MTHPIIRTVTLLFACALSVSGMAAPVDRATALRQAKRFLSGKGITLTGQQPSFAAPKRAGTPGKTSDYYIFNADNGKGFVVVSGDDRTPAVLGYSLNGSLDLNHLPYTIKGWLQGYQDEIGYLDSMKVTTASAKAGMRRAAAARETRKPISALLTTRWNQDEPYWNSCPVFGDLRGYTGCVATAMAQVMYHHRANSVKATTKEIPSYTYRFNSVYYYRENAVPAGTAIDWDNMLDDYSRTQATDIQKKAVADFIHICGDAVQMMYSPFASGAYDQEVAKAMVNYFGYDASTAFVQRADYTMENWNRIIYNELKNNRPVVYGGMSTASSSGHCFVIDGYDGDEYFHVNWGWGGVGDGYFLLTSLLPDETGIGAGEVAGGFQYYQDAIINAQPSVGGEYTDIPLYISGLTLLKDGKIATGFGNPGLYENKFTVGFGTVDEAGNVTPLATTECKIGTSYLYEVLYQDTFDLKNNLTAPGTYHIVPISHDSNHDKWIISWDNYNRHYIKAVVADDGTITMTTMQPAYDLECEMFRVGGTMSAIQGHSMTATIRNKGISFDGHIHFFIFSNGHRVYQDSVYVGIQQGGTQTMSTAFLPADTGSYTAAVATDIEGKNILRTVDFKIIDEEKYNYDDAFLVKNINVRGLSENNPGRDEGSMLWTVYGDSISGGMTLYATKSMKRATPLIVLQRKTGGTWTPVDSTQQAMQTIQENQDYFTDFNFTHLEAGIYKLTIKYQHWTDSTFTWITDWVGDFDHFQLGYGVTTYKARGHKENLFTGTFTVPNDVLAADLRGCKAADVKPNNNPNTVYIVREDDDYSSLNGKNVVIFKQDENCVANTINVDDDHDFYTPVSFTAKEAYYTRLFNDNGTYSTLMLPFAPNRITNSNTVMPIGGNSVNAITITEFSGNNDTKSVFTAVGANGVESNLPYLIKMDNVRGKSLTFSATNAAFTASPKRSGIRSESYKFTGVLATDTIYNAYTLSADGMHFDFHAMTVAHPFRGYFFGYDQVSTDGINFAPITINNGKVNAINGMTINDNNDKTVYNLQGQKLGTMDSRQMLKQGTVYVVKGKKFISK